MEPNEIVIAHFDVYLAPVGETFPDVDDTPGGNWSLLGNGGNLSMGEEALTVTHTQQVDLHRTYGSTGPRKASRSSEDLMIAFTLVDLTLEHYTRALNNVAVTDVAADTGKPGYRHINLHRGRDVYRVALLARGELSVYGDDLEGQYEVPIAVQTGSPAPAFTKTDMAALALEFMALEDASADSPFGRLVMQDAVAL